MMTSEDLSKLLEKHSDVPGVSVAISDNYEIQSIAAGYASIRSGELMTTNHYLQCASLSKTVGTAFAIDYFKKRSIPMATSVNSILMSASSSWLISLPPDSTSNVDYSPDEVTLAMLVNHTALGMHYVYGIPLSHPTPSPIELLNGSCRQYGYEPLYLLRRPGERFAYSGGGFIVLQLLIELLENRPIQEVTREYLNSVGLKDFTFIHENVEGKKYAIGHLNRHQEVQPDDSGRLKFSPFAAGALCTPRSLLSFLIRLAKAYKNIGLEADNGISNHVARLMLGEQSLQDLGAVEFMRARVGLGVFVANAGPNKFMLHQAANDGFRGVYLVCFDGPDAGKGFIILSNGDNPAVYLQCELAKFLLSYSNGKGLNITGVDFGRLEGSGFDMKGLKQETIVNLGLRDLVLAAFDDPYADSVLNDTTKSRL